MSLPLANSLDTSSRRSSNSAVVARLDRAIQYAAAFRSFTDASGILDPRFRGDDGDRHGRASSFTVIVRQKREARLRSDDRAIQYAAASRSFSNASGILDPRFRGDDDL
jgi:hypothetical protein